MQLKENRFNNVNSKIQNQSKEYSPESIRLRNEENGAIPYNYASHGWDDLKPVKECGCFLSINAERTYTATFQNFILPQKGIIQDG